MLLRDIKDDPYQTRKLIIQILTPLIDNIQALHQISADFPPASRELKELFAMHFQLIMAQATLCGLLAGATPTSASEINERSPPWCGNIF